MVFRNILTVLLVLLAIVMQSAGGVIDMKQADSVTVGNMTISKQHFWSDAHFLLMLAVIVQVSGLLTKRK